MEASKKLFALFLICIVVISSCVDVSMAEEKFDDEKYRKKYEEIGGEYQFYYNRCLNICKSKKLDCKTHCGGETVQSILKSTKYCNDPSYHFYVNALFAQFRVFPYRPQLIYDLLVLWSLGRNSFGFCITFCVLRLLKLERVDFVKILGKQP